MDIKYNSLTATEKKYVDDLTEGNVSFPMIPKNELTQSICIIAVKVYTLDFVTVPNQYKTNAMCEYAVSCNHNLFKYVPENLRSDKICIIALDKSKEHYNILSDALKMKFLRYGPPGTLSPIMRKFIDLKEKDRDLNKCVKVVEENAACLMYVPSKYIEEAYFHAVRFHKTPLLKYVNEGDRTKKICIDACTRNAQEIYLVPEKERTKELFIIVVKVDASLFSLAPLSLSESIYFSCVSEKNHRDLAYATRLTCVSENVIIDMVSRDGMNLRYLVYTDKNSITQKIADMAFKTTPTCVHLIPKKFITEVMISKYCELYPQYLTELSGDILTEELCIKLVKEDPEILHHLPKRYRTENVCLNAFLKRRSVITSIPECARLPEMWAEAVKMDPKTFPNVPCDRIDESVLIAYVSNASVVELNYLTKTQRIFVYSLINKKLVSDKSKLVRDELNFRENSSYINEFIVYTINTGILSDDQKTVKHIDLFQFEGIEMTGDHAMKLAQVGKLNLVKLTNESEKHRNIQYKTGENIDDKMFSIQHYASAGGLYCTTQCREGEWSNYNSDIGAMYWRREVKFKSNGRVYIENGYKIKADCLILGDRTKL